MTTVTIIEMTLYVLLFLGQGWIVGMLLKDNWEGDDRLWFRIVLVAFAVVFYVFLAGLIWCFIHDPTVRGTR